VLIELVLVPPRNEVEELPPRSVLDHHEDVRGRVNKFVMLDDVRVIELPQYLDFSLHLLKNTLLLDLLLAQDFDCHFSPCYLMESQFDFAK